jgi:hypothetical protein
VLDVDSKLDERQRLVRRERRPVTGRASPTTAGTIRLIAIGSTSGYDDGALGSSTASRSFLQWAAMTANKAGFMQMASVDDRSGLEGTPIFMAPELFDGSACPNEATDTHALGMTCRAVRRDRVLVGHCESRRRRQAARACPIGSLRLFAACGHQTPPLASCRKFCWSSTRNEADVVRKLSLRERHRQRERRERRRCHVFRA